MEKTIYCPKCGSAVLKQIEPVHGRIRLVCADCRSGLVLTFENGKLTAVLYESKGEVWNDQN